MILFGTGSGSITSSSYNIVGTIKTICLWNRGSAGVASVGIVVDGVNTFVFAANLAANAAAGSSVYQEANIKVKSGWQIIISSSVSIDYYILVE